MADSKVLVGVEPSDFASDYVLAGCELQEKIEKAAYEIGKGAIPINTVGSFLFGDDFKLGKVKPSVKPKFIYANFEKIFPAFICESLKVGIINFGKKIPGFDDREAVLTAPETRSSAPVRILREQPLMYLQRLHILK